MIRKQPASPPAFEPVSLRHRGDGWTPQRQSDFIAALAANANVAAAAKAVGMGVSGAYALRARAEAGAFREAWDIAIDYACHQLAEAAFDRALNGTVRPIFYKGEQVGEDRRYDDRLAMFILRLRDPVRFGRWREERTPVGHFDTPALRLTMALARLKETPDPADGGIVKRPVPNIHLLTPEELGTRSPNDCGVPEKEDDDDDDDWSDDADDADHALGE